jgi:predicted O-methyltransferase YrrM
MFSFQVAKAALPTAAELCYTVIMTSSIDSIDNVMPSATPTEEEIRAWEALARDEQLRRLRAALEHPDCATATTATMSDILAVARARADAKRRG